MKITNIPFEKTGYFSKTICDYLNESPELKSFYNRFPNLESFKDQLEEKRKSSSLSMENRQVLVEALEKQYKNIETSGETIKNIKALGKENTFTITTGHQLNLFTGPLYFLYKIISAINLCEELAVTYPKDNFVPIYWMASEDHDFEEINYFNFSDKKVQWNSSQTGAVGRFSTEGLHEVFNEFSRHLGNSSRAIAVKELFTEAYLNYDNLADATRYLANKLFQNYGLVIVDADAKALKKLFIPFVERELFENVSFKTVTKTIASLGQNYKIQVNPREINLFYINEGIRERIIKTEEGFKVNNTSIAFSEATIKKELQEYPERFSPNVIMRPLYQEVILPNLCYIGGGGELAYWLELKSYFEAVAVTFPMLLLRNSVQIISEKQYAKMQKIQISDEEIFLKRQPLVDKKVKEASELQVDFSKQKDFLKKQFEQLKEIAKLTDVSFVGAVNAQERKQIKGLENLEKRLLRAEKRKHSDLVTAITDLRNVLFPNESLEERYRNFSEYYMEYGEELIPTLKENLKPLSGNFSVFIL